MMQTATVHSALGLVDYLFRASCLGGTGCLHAGGICLGLLPTNRHFASWVIMAVDIFEISEILTFLSFQGDMELLFQSRLPLAMLLHQTREHCVCATSHIGAPSSNTRRIPPCWWWSGWNLAAEGPRPQKAEGKMGRRWMLAGRQYLAL